VWGNSRRAKGLEDVETDKRIAGIPHTAFRGCWFIRFVVNPFIRFPLRFLDFCPTPMNGIGLTPYIVTDLPGLRKYSKKPGF